MFWTWNNSKGEEYITWGKPRNTNDFQNLKPDYSIKLYEGELVNSSDKAVWMMEGDATLGMGDSMWLINYLRDFYKFKGHRKCQVDISTSKDIADFYSNFLPKSFNFIEEHVKKEKFDSYEHKLPSMYYWKERDESDRSWLDNQSILERLYNLTGIKYEGLSDWRDFTPDYILYPEDDFYERLGIKKEEKYVFFQWHSSGVPKNLPPKTNIKLLKHITSKYNIKCYVIGRLSSLDKLEKIPNVVNLSNKTLATDVFSLAANADFIVCPDSAGLHLGEAYHVPTVAIMSVLPPVYVASKYKIPSFMFGSGFCPYKPCGVVTELPLDKCPQGTEHYCSVLSDVDLDLFDNCLNKSISNRDNFRSQKATNFYASQNLPIVM